MCEKENIELNSNGGQLSRRLFDNEESAQSKTSKNELVEKLDPSVDKWNISGM